MSGGLHLLRKWLKVAVGKRGHKNLRARLGEHASDAFADASAPTGVLLEHEVAGEEVIVAKAVEPREQIIDIVAALKQSLAEGGAREPKGKKAPKKKAAKAKAPKKAARKRAAG